MKGEMKRIKSSRSLSCLSVTSSTPKHTTHTLQIPVYSVLFVLVCVCVCLFAGNRSATSAGCTMGKWSRSEGRNIKTDQQPEQPPPQPVPSRPPPSCAHAGLALVLDCHHIEDNMAATCLPVHPNVPHYPIFCLITVGLNYQTPAQLVVMVFTG